MLGKLIFSIAIILICSKGLLFYSGSREDDKRILILAFIMLVLVLGCRNVESTNSHDVNAYYHTYEAAIDYDSMFLFLDFNPALDKGYLALTWLLSKIVRWPQFILLFEAAFCCGITLRFIYIYSEDVLLSVLGFMSLGIMGFYMTGFRQSMAISLCLLALEMADKKKLAAFAALVLAAMCLHQTAIIFLPVYFIMEIKVNRLLSIVEAGLLLLAGFSLPFLITLGNDIFHREYSGTFVGNKMGGIINILFGVFVVFSMVYQLGDCTWTADTGNGQEENVLMEDKSFEGHKFLYILILGTGLYAMRYQALVMERISFYYTPAIFVLLPGAIQNGFARKDWRLLRLVLMAGMLFLINWRFGPMDYVPFWNGTVG